MKQSEIERLTAITAIERTFWKNKETVAGLDEVGRGPLAGPVVVACVMLPEEMLIEGVNDSKKVSEKRREKIFEEIRKNALGIGLGIVDQTVIDEINILQATKRAAVIALNNMPVKPEHLLTDSLEGLNVDVTQHAFIKGDQKSYLIAAASIYAKVTRDRIMAEYDKLYPEYGFLKNKGYGTREHVEAILKYGPCPLHRKSFLKKITGEQAWTGAV